MSRTAVGSFLAVDDRPVHVRLDGPQDAPPVLLVHGFACSLHWYDDLVAELSEEFRLIRVDLHGHGCTGGSTGLDPESQARMVDGVLEQLGVIDGVVVGHSYGADVALATARATNRITRVVLVGQAPAYGRGLSRLPRLGVVMTIPVLGPVLHRVSPAAVVRQGSRIAFAGRYRATRAMSEQGLADHQAMTGLMYREVLTHRGRRLAVDGLDEQLRRLGLPSLVVLGERDQMYPVEPSRARYLAADARVVVVPDAGHSVQVEQPVTLARLLRDFVTG
jgi:pimeloyl-ACP methyl ester carboxylesterase